MMEEFWVTKYALTKGVFRIAGNITSSGKSCEYVSEPTLRFGHQCLVLRLSKDVFRSKKKAIEKAIAIVENRILLNRRQNKKLSEKIIQWRKKR